MNRCKCKCMCQVKLNHTHKCKPCLPGCTGDSRNQGLQQGTSMLGKMHGLRASVSQLASSGRKLPSRPLSDRRVEVGRLLTYNMGEAV
jgi:hypothetical protein